MIRALALATLALGAAAEEHWAVLAAGSNGFWNYRHQADVCHAYQILIKRGFHPDRIITLMYDDVANSTQNPFKGKLYNFPWKTMAEAVDVYAGCKLDYTGKQVTPDTFVAVLSGDAKAAGGKVLQSTSEDHVFVNFVDHGGVGLVAFPGDADVLHSSRLISTLKAMHQKGMYKQLSFYLETCESGSMFQGLLPEDLPVYAVTAANAGESSWGTFCGAEATVGGKSIRSCLGDLFSVNWMMDSEQHIGDKETLEAQYEKVKGLTNKSHVMQYGQVSTFDSELVSDFQGPAGKSLVGVAAAPSLGHAALAHASAVDSRNAKLDQLYRDFTTEGSSSASALLIEEIQAKQAVAQLGQVIKTAAIGNAILPEFPTSQFSWTAEMLACHEAVAVAFGARCGWTEGRLVLSKVLYQLCAATGASAAPIHAALRESCPATQSEFFA